MADIIDMLIQERAQLEAELRNDSRYLKVQRINELLAAYQAGTTRPNSIEVTPRQRSKGRIFKERKETKSELIKREIKSWLAQHGTAHRSQILSRLIERGLMGSEKNSMQSLAMYLSVSKDMFKSDGNGNYALATRKEGDALTEGEQTLGR